MYKVEVNKNDDCTQKFSQGNFATDFRYLLQEGIDFVLSACDKYQILRSKV
jgi:hypothetical protein